HHVCKEAMDKFGQKAHGCCCTGHKCKEKIIEKNKKEAKSRNPDDYKVVETRPFKLKNHPPRRSYQTIDLRNVFGQIPELIAIQKVQDRNNCFVIKAFVKKTAEDRKADRKAKKEEKKINNKKKRK
ncbi:MAG: hypothetical protein KAS07_05075, partial [Candidatus Pacebacteria bacterium]|nr:hypothetical protein [Candidatus Paceibacterota bacterium]